MKLWIVIVISISFLSGCWDYRELNNLTVVTGMAIDKGNKAKYLLTIEGVNAAELNDKTAEGFAPSMVFTLEGDSIAELSQKMNIGFARFLVYSHMRTLIISEEVAKEGTMEFIDFLERNREVRDDFNILIARKVKAADILRVNYQFQKSSSLKLFIQLRTMAKVWGGDPNVRMNDVIAAWTSPGKQPVMETVTIKGKVKKGGSVDNMKKVTPDAIVVIDSLAVFKGDKLKGFLSLKDTRNYLWTQDEIKQTSITVACGKERKNTVRVYTSKTHTDADLKKGKAKIKINIHIVGYLEGVECPYNMSQPQGYEAVEKKLLKVLRKDIKSTIVKAQKKYKSDIFGFGEELYRQHPKKFKTVEKDWDTVFSKADIDVNVTVTLRRSGLRSKSFLENIR